MGFDETLLADVDAVLETEQIRHFLVGALAQAHFSETRAINKSRNDREKEGNGQEIQRVE